MRWKNGGKRGNFHCTWGKNINFEKGGGAKISDFGRNLLITAIQYISIFANKVKDPGPKAFKYGSRKCCYPDPGYACRTFFLTSMVLLLLF